MAPKTKHHKIVALETFWCPMPTFEVPPGHTFEITEYTRTAVDEVSERIKNATVIITTIIPLCERLLSEDVCPNLEFINVMASGTDCLHLPTCRRRGITVSSCNTANIVAVSEHTIAMYFAARRMFGVAQLGLRRNDWVEKKAMLPMFRDAAGNGPPVCEEETLGIVGYGPIGKRIHIMASALGMNVLVSDRKNATTPVEGRTPFKELIQQATVIVCSLPRNPETIDLISTAELREMRPSALVINVSRGGIVNEVALVEALREKWIYGAGLDVWAVEPAGPVNTALLEEDTRDLNLITTPHTAWYATKTFKNYQAFLKENLYAWCENKPVRVVV